MITRVLAARISEYAPADEVEQENVLQELMQHFVLASLSAAGFFQRAAFHGGTCLRILYGMNRFSEDLDFLALRPEPDFRWADHLARVAKDCRQEGIEFEEVDRSDLDAAIRKAFLKTDSIGKLLMLGLPFERHRRRKVRIKLEIDTRPPEGSSLETRFLTFPRPAAIVTQSLASGFGLKLHALLCRAYTKGRDWYDLVWYVSRRIAPDLEVLASALAQQGPWAGRRPEVTMDWLLLELRRLVAETDWPAARRDIERFLAAREQPALAHWGPPFFEQLLEQLANDSTGPRRT
jgi:predicted nucleotidyltransferase component of viral defense system